ncbi:MAG: hypothetical protein DRI26_04490 [Chloroflexi bacterium]|nr:MAG: hypothetical protein DRI26_04490 [Chloroflexota bacterium]
MSGEIKTPNPPIKVTLRKVGVYENGEAPLREVLDPKGEIYLYVVVEDGKAQEPKPLRVPYQDYYHLKDNEITDVDMEVFYTQEVGNYLHVFVSAWENDGGGFEQLVQRAIGTAIIETATGGTGIGALFGDVLGNLVGKFLGSEDDHIGDYEQVWYPGKCWGAGEHCVERGNLRLWFDISSPAFTKAAPTCTSMPRETPTSPAPAPIVPFPEPSPATISVTPAPAPVVPSSPSVVPSSITVTLDSVFIKDDHDPIGKGEVYFLVALASEDGRVGVWRRIPSDGHFSVASGAVICLPAPGNLLRFSADSRNYGLYIGVWEEDHHECSRSKLATWMRQRQGEFWPQLLDATTKLSQCGDDLIGQVSKVVGLNNIGRHTSLVGDCEVNYTVSIKPQ